MAEEFYIGQIFEESYPSEASEWCYTNNATIREIEPENNVRRFQIKKQETQSIDSKKADIRDIRNQYINNIEWRLSRYRDQVEMGMVPVDSEENYLKIMQYIQYLRDYPASSETWYEQKPLDFNSWCELAD